MNSMKQLPKGPMKILYCGQGGDSWDANVNIRGSFYTLIRTAKRGGHVWSTRDGGILDSGRAMALERIIKRNMEKMDRIFEAAKEAEACGDASSATGGAKERVGTPSQPKEYVASVSIKLVENDEGKTDGQWRTRTGGSERSIRADEMQSAFGLLGACINEAIEAVAMDRELVMMMLADAVTEEPFEHLHLQCNEEMKKEFREFWEAANKISSRW